MLILDAELAIIDRIKCLLGKRLRMVDSIPADWDDDTLGRLLRDAPGVYVSFAGGPAPKTPQQGPTVHGRFSLVSVTRHASGEKARRHGDQREIGAYEIIEILARSFHGYTLDGIGTMHLDAIDNLYTGTLDKQGAAVYATAFSVPLTFDSNMTPDQVEDFLRYRDDFDLAPKNDQVDAQDRVDLPAASEATP